MRTPDPFHEAKQALNSARVEYSAVGSLSLASALTPVHACDLAIRELYTLATGALFPYDRFVPQHQPGRLVEALAIRSYYSNESQRFLDKLQGYALHDARYEGTQPYKDYTNPKSAGKAKEVIDGAERFIRETESLANNHAVLDTTRRHAR